jgi:hypothetical protein
MNTERLVFAFAASFVAFLLYALGDLLTAGRAIPVNGYASSWQALSMYAALSAVFVCLAAMATCMAVGLRRSR